MLRVGGKENSKQQQYKNRKNKTSRKLYEIFITNITTHRAYPHTQVTCGVSLGMRCTVNWPPVRHRSKRLWPHDVIRVYEHTETPGRTHPNAHRSHGTDVLFDSASAAPNISSPDIRPGTRCDDLHKSDEAA